MKLDDIAADLVARNASFVAAYSTVGVPLVAITSKMVFLREFKEPTGKACFFIESDQEEVAEITPSFRIVTLPVTVTVFTMGAAEAVLREQAANYALAILACLRLNPYYFSITSRDDFEGVEGKADIKATKMAIDFKYEEAS